MGAAAFLGCSSGPGSASGGDVGTKVDAGSEGVRAVHARDGSAMDSGVSSGGCPYPSGPYGTAVGDVLDPTLVWQVYAPGATTPSTLRISDLLDCDGKKGINAVVFDTSAQWCVACQAEAQSIPAWVGSTGAGAGDWTSLGVRFVTLIIQNDAYEPATIVTAQQWRAMFDLTSIYVGADPNASLPADALPHNLLVDPRTMKISQDLDNDDSAGTPQADPAVAALAKKNAQ
jgi:thiol-disulfide isomerase/thioredoxin